MTTNTVKHTPADAREWQDISTAPKDGTNILAVVAGRHPDTGVPFVPEVVEWTGDGWWNEMWRGGNNSGVYDPTHWMPLPTPPAPQEKGEG